MGVKQSLLGGKSAPQPQSPTSSPATPSPPATPIAPEEPQRAPAPTVLATPIAKSSPPPPPEEGTVLKREQAELQQLLDRCYSDCVRKSKAVYEYLNVSKEQESGSRIAEANKLLSTFRTALEEFDRLVDLVQNSQYTDFLVPNIKLFRADAQDLNALIKEFEEEWRKHLEDEAKAAAEHKRLEDEAKAAKALELMRTETERRAQALASKIALEESIDRALQKAAKLLEPKMTRLDIFPDQLRDSKQELELLLTDAYATVLSNFIREEIRQLLDKINEKIEGEKKFGVLDLSVPEPTPDSIVQITPPSWEEPDPTVSAHRSRRSDRRQNSGGIEDAQTILAGDSSSFEEFDALLVSIESAGPQVQQGALQILGLWKKHCPKDSMLADRIEAGIGFLLAGQLSEPDVVGSEPEQKPELTELTPNEKVQFIASVIVLLVGLIAVLSYFLAF